MTPVNDPVAAVVLCANAANVDSVFVAGQAVKRHGALLDVDLPRLCARLRTARDRIRARARAVDVEQMRALVAPAFPLS